MAPAEITPDFDKMTPDEIMAWMESLAKRQGAKSEELTTSADMTIPEIDPDSVVIDEPGYVPYGEDRPARPEPPRAPTPQDLPRTSPLPPRPTSPAPGAGQAGGTGQFQRPTQPGSPFTRPPQSPPQTNPFSRSPQGPPATNPFSRPQTPPSEPSNPFSRSPQGPQPPRQTGPLNPRPTPAEPELPRQTQSVVPTPPRPTPPEPPVSPLDTSALEWLESLAADPSDSLFNLDLSALSQELEPPKPAPSQPAQTSPLEWLETLTNDDSTQTMPAARPPEPPQRESQASTLAWLESLSQRQVSQTTPEPSRAPVTPVEEPDDALRLEDPSDFLGSLADPQGFDESSFDNPAIDTLEDEADEHDIFRIEQAISTGMVTPEQMQVYLEEQTDRYVASLSDDEDEPEDGEPVPAELPDWLLEQVGTPPAPPATREDLTPLSEIMEQGPPTDLPDWLQGPASAEDDLDFSSIFVEDADSEIYTPPEPLEVEAPAHSIQTDPDDPWAEAFDLEQAQADADVPEWYEQNLHDPARIAAVEELIADETEESWAEVVATALPIETELAPGEPMPVPADLFEAAAPVPEAEVEVEPEAPPTDTEVPDWLREADVDVAPEEVPDWLRETIDEPEPAPVATPAPEFVAPAVRAGLPASAAVAEARVLVHAGDLTAALSAYESLIRTNSELEVVADDLDHLARARKNPSVYRVLGDAYMRQGRLQSALDTYREALNQL